MMRHSTRNGFALPAVIAISTGIITILLAILQLSTVLLKESQEYYYIKLAEEAGEAGAAYASACLQESDNQQTWGALVSKPNLTPSSSCDGTSNTYSSNNYVFTATNLRTSFSVSNLDFRFDNAVQISSQGTVELLDSGGNVTKTYTTIIKKALTWPTTYLSTKSVSGTSRTCGIVSESVYCWGTNGYGQLGNGTTTNSLTPVKVVKAAGVLADKSVSDLAAAQSHNCAIADGKAYCWGRNQYGQLGNGTTTSSSVPILVQGSLTGKTVTKVGSTNWTSCAIADGKIYCWGANGNVGLGTAYGTVGANSSAYAYASFTTPTLVRTSADGVANGLPAGYTATTLTSGSRSNTMCAIADGKAYCWGENGAGQIGDGTTTNRLAPTKVLDTGVLSGKTVTYISQDGYGTGSGVSPPPHAHVCAVANSLAYCWGDNTSGQLGDNTYTSRSQPVAVNTAGLLSGKSIAAVEVGIRHSCALAVGKVYCWGSDISGQLGDGAGSSSSSIPVAVAEESTGILGETITQIGGGGNRGCATTSKYRSFCWGLNGDGQIGDGTTIDRYTPSEALFLKPAANQYIF